MANTILLKKSSTAAAQPTAGQLSAGELAINTADGRLFAKNSAGTVVNLPVSSISGQTITPGKIIAGTSASATGTNAAVLGGRYNSASGYGSVVGGGNVNIASAANSAVGGGRYNTASGH